MRLFYPLSLAISLKYVFNSQAHRFASFVALLSILGITLGVAALIIDTSIMQGLQNNLKQVVLNNTAHVIVKAPYADSDKLLSLDKVVACAPYLEDEVLLQTSKKLALITLAGVDTKNLHIKNGYSKESLKLASIPQKGSFTLNAQASIYLNNELGLNTKVRLISTKNARYTPLGITPTQRIFTLKEYFPSTSNQTIALGNYDDVRRLLRYPKKYPSVRLWLVDPFEIDKVSKKLSQEGYEFTTWQHSLGEFFKAVAMEKLTMAIMIFLVIVVAAFNILSALSMMVSARLNEIAILKTLGLNNRKILTIFLNAGLFVGVIGTALGTILGVIATYFVANNFLQGFLKVSVCIDNTNLLIIALSSISMSLLFTLYPAIKASKCDAISNLGRG
ncbi:MAG: FtsX-like permease family protein [Succinivibrio sp.]|nr:FtsX-like permease family protein [Succinivibrio sp.]